MEVEAQLAAPAPSNVGKGKEIVTLTQDARVICYVAQTTVILPWDLVGIGTAVMIQ